MENINNNSGQGLSVSMNKELVNLFYKYDNQEDIKRLNKVLSNHVKQLKYKQMIADRLNNVIYKLHLVDNVGGMNQHNIELLTIDEQLEKYGVQKVMDVLSKIHHTNKK